MHMLSHTPTHSYQVWTYLERKYNNTRSGGGGDGGGGNQIKIIWVPALDEWKDDEQTNK